MPGQLLHTVEHDFTAAKPGWSSYGTLVYNNGVLECANTTAYSGIYLADTALRNSYGLIEVPQVNRGDGIDEAYFIVGNGGDGYLSIQVLDDAISAREAKSGSILATAAYSATTHRWWLIGESGGVTYFQTSPDGITWTDLWRGSNFANINYDSGTVEFGCGFYQGTTSTYNFHVTNFNSAPLAAVSAELELLYNDLVLVSDTFTPRHQTLAGVIDTFTPRYNSTVSVADSIALSYRILDTVDDVFGLLYNTQAVVSDSFEVLYYTESTSETFVVSASLTLQHNVQVVISGNFQATYKIQALVSDFLLIPYNVTTSVNDLLSLLWNDTVVVSDTFTPQWNALSEVVDNISLRYDVKEMLHAAFSFILKWRTHRDWDKLENTDSVWTPFTNDEDVWTPFTSEERTWTH